MDPGRKPGPTECLNFLSRLPAEQGLGLLYSIFGLFGLLLVPFKRFKGR